METEKKRNRGRHPKEELEVKEIFISFRLNVQELVEFERLRGNSGAKTRTEFVKSCVFERPLKTIIIDKGAEKYWKLLNNLQAQYRAIGNNYNQNTKALKSSFEEKKALAFLYKLQQATLELVAINKEVIKTTQKFEEKWLQK